MKAPGLLLIILLITGLLPAQNKHKKALQELDVLFEKSELFDQIFTGFVLYNPDSGETLYNRDGHKYFTPASNTKIFTLYASLRILKDSIIALRYMETEDALYFWGTANPMFLHPDIKTDSSVYTFLKANNKALYFSDHNFKEERFGPGWAWDDYNGYYQAENSPLPIYSNMATVKRVVQGEGFDIYPSRLTQQLTYDPDMDNDRIRIKREEHNNVFRYNSRALTGAPFDKYLPFFTSPDLTAVLLSDTLGKRVQLAHELPEEIPVQSISVPIPDTLYRRLMQDSDNFIAEQLLMACSEKLTGSIKTSEAIQYAKDSLLTNLPDELIWRDGSGLSRYNLFTPRSIVGVLDSIYHLLPRARLLDIFPAGGVSGTIEDLYPGDETPYVYAKTGTLSNKHCLSGYLLADSGQWYIFSFMNNNYVNGTKPVKEEMEKILKYIRIHF